MPGFTRNQLINGSPEAVFEFATDLSHASKWIEGLTACELITDPPMRMGSKLRETRRVGKREATTVINIIIHEGPRTSKTPPYRHSAKAAAMGVEATYHFTFASGGRDTTRVDVRCEVRSTNLLGRLFTGMATRAMRKQD